jgi:hypothetical protein
MGGIGLLQGSSTQWDDLCFPAQAINPSGATTAASVDGNSGVLLFSGSSDNAMSVIAQMPHCWKLGSTIYPHLHLRFPTSATADTRWKLEYDIASIAGNFTNALGTYTDGGTITVANPANTTKHNVASFNSISMTGFGLSSIILFKITRLASTDAADTDTNNVALLAFDVHYEIDSIGSEDEFTK